MCQDFVGSQGSSQKREIKKIHADSVDLSGVDTPPGGPVVERARNAGRVVQWRPIMQGSVAVCRAYRW